MATLRIKTNAAQGTDVLIKDLGFEIPNSGGFVDLTDFDEILRAQGSDNLRAFVVDDAHGAGSSTLILNDGTTDIAQADASNFLDTVVLPDGDDVFGVVKNDANGEISTPLTFDGTTGTVTNLLLANDADAGGFKLTNLAAGVAAGDAATKAQLDAVSSTAKVWKELILHEDQLDSTNDAISQAIAFFLDGNAANADTLVISDGTTTETFTFLNSPAVAFDVQIGAGADDTMDNLVSQINTDSTLWSAVQSTTLESINDGSGTSTAGEVTVIHRTNNSTQDSFTDRIYGTFATSANAQYVNYNGEADYELSTNTQLPSGDPTVKTFGFGRATVNLTANETHQTRSADFTYTWDADDAVWQNTGANAILAGTGATKAGLTINVNGINGIIANADNLEPDYGEVGDIAGVGAANAAGVLNEIARADHVHDHGDQGATVGSLHDADQVDVEGTFARINAPNVAETVLSQINDNFGDPQYVGKWLPFGTANSVPGSGTRYLESSGIVVSSAVGLRMLRSGTITGASLQVDVIDASRSYNLSIKVNGTQQATVALATSTLGASSTALAATYVAGDTISVSLERQTGSGPSAFDNAVALLEFDEGG